MTSESLGHFLRNEREKKGLTIEQVASATKISVRLLHAIENDQFVDLPAKPFIRGFVIAYSRFVGFNGKDALSRYGSFIDNKALERPTGDAVGKGYEFEKKSTEQSRTILWVMMVGFVVMAGVGMLVLNPRFKHKNLTELRSAHNRTLKTDLPVTATLPEPQASAVVDEKVQVIEIKPKTVTAQAEEKTEPVQVLPRPVAEIIRDSSEKVPKVAKHMQADPLRIPESADPQHKGDAYLPDEISQKVVLKAQKDVWIRYQVDNKPITSFVLKAEKWIVFRGNDIIRFQVADPAVMEIRYGSREFKPLDAFQEKIQNSNSTPTLAFPLQRTAQSTSVFSSLSPLPKIDASLVPSAANSQQ